MDRDTTVGDDRPERTVDPTRADENGAFRHWHAETEWALNDADAARVDVYVRSMLPPPGAKEGQADALRKLDGLVEESLIDDVTVNVWGERICLCDDCRDTDTGRMLLDTVRELRRWGDEYDASARSFFERRTTGSHVTGNSYDGIRPPRVACALYLDGALSGVFPSRFGDRPVSVHEFHDAIAPVAASESYVDADEPANRLQRRSGE